MLISFDLCTCGNQAMPGLSVEAILLVSLRLNPGVLLSKADAQIEEDIRFIFYLTPPPSKQGEKIEVTLYNVYDSLCLSLFDKQHE